LRLCRSPDLLWRHLRSRRHCSYNCRCGVCRFVPDTRYEFLVAQQNLHIKWSDPVPHMNLRPLSLALLFPLLMPACFAAQRGNLKQGANDAYLLRPDQYHHYVTEFSRQEVAATGKHGVDPWPWMEANIPWFSSSDKSFEEMYYFRWFAWQKHVVSTPKGFVITEFLVKVPWGGYANTIVDAAPFHLHEARWLRNPRIASDDARFWMSPAAAPRNYSVALADAIESITLATGKLQLGIDLLPAMEANYQAWVATHQDPNGLFWSIDTRDAMEHSISGDGYRPTLNSYMYADARAIAELAAEAGDSAASTKYAARAAAQRERIEKYLWNPRNQFYEVVSPAPNSGIRKENKFVDPGTVMQFSGVRELIGYIPWDFDIPPVDHAVAWKQIFSPQGFAGKYGPTTAERRSPRFRFPNDDQCQWNGPSWPFATTQALWGLANLEDDQQQDVMTPEDYYRLFQEYLISQHLRLANGQVIPWIDEDLNADTDEWIARDILAERHSPLAGRGAYYNHSGFADPLITGLLGLRPEAGNTIVLHPLLPEGAWSYFALDGLPYHGHWLTIVYDATGQHYHRGQGFFLYVDGVERAERPTLGPLQYTLPPRSAPHQS